MSVTLGAVAAGVVGGALLISGTLKLASPMWRAQAHEIGAPSWVVPLIPPLELVLGALVAVRVARVLTGVVATLVLLAFTMLLIVRLMQGRTPPCACFGRLSNKPIGPWSVVRNMALMGLTIVAAYVS